MSLSVDLAKLEDIAIVNVVSDRNVIEAMRLPRPPAFDDLMKSLERFHGDAQKLSEKFVDLTKEWPPFFVIDDPYILPTVSKASLKTALEVRPFQDPDAPRRRREMIAIIAAFARG